jgi:CelD/BcsL family acetyltransferase involved in cellulose biosynthesis
MPDLVGSKLSSRVIERVEDLADYEDAWDHLAVAASKPMCRPAWLRSWWAARCEPAHGASRALRVVVVTDPERLLAVVPCYVLDRMARLPDIRLLGQGAFWGVEPLLSADAPDETLGLAARALSETLPRPARLVLDSALGQARWPQELRSQWPGGPAWLRRGRRGELLMIEGPLSFSEWLAARSKDWRSELRRRERHAVQAGIRVRCTDSPDAVDVDLRGLARLHHARWNHRSAWLRPGVEDAIAAAGRELIAKGGFRLWVVEHGDQMIGAALLACAGDSSQFVMTGFDPGWSRFGPGISALVAGIKQQLDAGSSVIDFGYGGFSYIRKMANASYPVVWYELFPTDWRTPAARARWLPEHCRERTNILRVQLRLGQRVRCLRAAATAQRRA